MPGTNEAFSRVKIDAQLKDRGWDVVNPHAVRFEYVLPDKTKADYVLCDRHGRALAVVEAKEAAINPAEAEAQAKAYAAHLKVPYIFLANGEEIRFWEWQREAFPRAIKTFLSQGDLERRAATGQVRRDPLPSKSTSTSSSATTRPRASTRFVARSRAGVASSSSRWQLARARPAPPRLSSSVCSRRTRLPASYSSLMMTVPASGSVSHRDPLLDTWPGDDAPSLTDSVHLFWRNRRFE